jgi:hypothetical protein
MTSDGTIDKAQYNNYRRRISDENLVRIHDLLYFYDIKNQPSVLARIFAVELPGSQFQTISFAGDLR